MSLLSQQLSDLAVDFPQEADKWSAFFNRLSVDEDLPPLPAVNSAKEKVYLAVRNVISEYYGVRQAEINLRKYAVYAPFDGVFSTVSKEVGRHRLRRGRDRHHHPDRPARTGSRRRTRLCALFFLRQHRDGGGRTGRFSRDGRPHRPVCG